MRQTIPLICLVLLTSGCAKLYHLDELLALQDLSINQDQRNAAMVQQDKNFRKLLSAVDAGTLLTRYPDKTGFEKAFGDPVFTKSTLLEGDPAEMWLYSFSGSVFGSEKVYAYFDASGRLVSFYRYVPAPKAPPQ